MTVVTVILCFRISRATPSELISWSTFINGLSLDMKNEFVFHFPQFQSEVIQQQSASAAVPTPLIYLSESTPPLIVNGTDSNANNCIMFAIHPESVVMSQMTRYLNRLDIMGFRVISSTVDNSSVETNSIKKCYTWTLQTIKS